MSAQSAKKKRIGSRRRVANQIKTSDGDELNVTDSISGAQHAIAEEFLDSVNVLVDSDNLKSETQTPSSPDVSENRRKLGSSRKIKGRHVKDSATTSYQTPREEVEEKMRGNETLRSTQPSLAIQTQRQEDLSQGSEHDIVSATHGSLYSAITSDYSEFQLSTKANCSEADLQAAQDDTDYKVVSELAEVMLGGTDNQSEEPKGNSLETMLKEMEAFEIVQTEEVCDQGKENAHTDTLSGIAELAISNLHSNVTVEQHFSDELNFREQPEEKHASTSFVTTERDEDTDVFMQYGNVQGNDLTSESHVKPVVTQLSTTPEITTDKSSPRENTEHEYSLEKAIFSSPKEELQKNEEQNEHYKLSDVKDTHHLENVEENVKEQQITTEMHEIDHVSKSVTHDSATEQKESNLEEHSTRENTFVASDDDRHQCDTGILQSSCIERVDTPLGWTYDITHNVEDDVRLSDEQTVHQEMKGILSEMKEIDSPSQALQSEIHFPLDFQPQQTDTDFNPIGNRRKLGSSRRKKGQQHVEESAAESHHEHKREDGESLKAEKDLETTQMLVSIEKASHEELNPISEHDVVTPETTDTSLYSDIMSSYSSEVQNPTTTNYPEADLESSLPKNEEIQEDHDERDTAFKVEVSNKPVGAILEGMDEPDSFQSQDLRGARQSEDAVDKVHDQEVHPTHEADASSENVTHDSTENSEIFSGILMDQAEISDTQQSELVVKSADNSGAEQEDSNPDDKQDEHPTEESSVEALKESTEDHHGYDTETPQISDTERVDTAEGHVFEIEDGLEDDIKHCADQVVHLEREGFISGMKESDSPPQTLQSENNFALNFQPQQTDTDFNPIGNRRKLGSTRRKKGQQHVEESAAESHHEHKQEDGESLKAEKDLETTQMLVSIEKASHEELSPISEHDVVTPETTDTSLYSDIMSSYSSEVQNPTTTNYPEADLESSLPKNEEIQEDHDERDTAFKVEVSNKPVGAILEGMDGPDSFQSQDLRGARQSEDAVDKVHDQEVHPTHEADASSENVTHDSTENSEIFSGILMDQAEISDTQQSELVVKSAANSGAEQEDSNPDDKQDEHPTEESSVEALKESTEDHHGYDTETPQISDTERVDTAEGHVFEIEDGLEDDIKHCADQVVHLEREGFISGMKESDSPPQTLQSENNFALNFQPQQTDTDFNPIGNRRKLGSTRRKKGQQHVEESAAESHHEHKREDVESLKGEKDLETTHMLVSIEKASHEELSPISEHDVVTPETTDTSLYSDIMSGYSSEIQNPTTTNYPEADLESSLPKNEEIQEDHDERDTAFKVEVSNKPVGAILEGMDEPDSFQSQDLRGARQSEDAVDKVHDQEVHPTHEADASSENVTHDSTEKSEIFSGNLMDQAEISDTQQSELVVKSADNSGAEQEDSNPDDKQDEHPTEESSVEALKESTEDHHGYDTETPQISDTERVDTAEGHVFEIEDGLEDDIKHCADQVVHLEREGFISGMKESDSPPQTLQSENNFALNFQPQQTDTDFNPIGNRRKLGSTRRKKGQQHVEESAAESHHEHKREDVESLKGEKDLETTHMLVSIEKASHEELSPISEHDVVTPETTDTSLYSDIMSGYSSEIQNPTTTNYPEADLESSLPKNEEIQEDHDERDTAFKVEVSNKPVGAILEGMDEPDSFQSQDLRGARQSEDAVDKVHDQEVHPTHEADASSENVTHDSTEKSEIFSGNLMDQAEISDTQQSELVVKSADNSGAEQEDSNPDDKQDEHPTEESSLEALKESTEDHHGYDTETPQISDTERVDTAEGHVFEIEDGLEDDIKHCADQVVHLEREGFISGMKESDSPPQTLQSENNFALNFQPQQTDTDFNPIGNRRKLGSTRRKKGQQHVEESAAESHHEHKQEDGESLKAEKDLETTHMLVSIEKASHEELSPISEHDVVTPETTDTSLYSDIMSSYSSEVQNPTTTNYPEADLESSLPKNEEIQEDHDERDTAFKVEVSNTPVGAILEGMDEPDSFQSQDLRSARQSEDAVDKVHDQEVHPTHEADASSENVTHDSTEKSEIFSGNLMDQAEISDTQQSELVVKSADNSGAEQEDSNPDDKQDEHPTEESSLEALKESTEDHHGYDTETPQISDTERVDTAEGHVFEIEDGLEDDIKHCADQVVHLEREGFISGMKEIDSPSQALQSEIHFPLDFQPQQTDTDFNPIGNRRKLGSSRRKKGQQHVEESAAESHHEHKQEDGESLKAEKDLETTHMLVSIEKASHEELSPISEHDVVTPETTDTSLYSDIMSGYSSEIQNPTTTNYPEADLESSLPKNEEVQEDHDERDTAFKMEVSNTPVGAILEGMDESDSFQSQDLRSARQSEDAVDKVHDQEVHPTHEADASSENVTHDSTEKSEIFSGNLMDQAEISDTQQSELVVKSADNSGAEQEDSNPDDKQDEHPTEQSSVEALKESTEDHHGYDTETPQISDIERVDTAEGQVFEVEGGLEDDIKHCADQVVHLEREGFISEMKEIDSPSQALQSEIHFPLDFQPQQTDTDFNPIGNRRKLGSSRRKKGQQHVEESAAESHHEHKREDVESLKAEKDLETTHMLVSIEKASHEELNPISEHDVVTPETTDTSLYSDIMSSYSSEIQNPTTTNYPEADLESSLPKNEEIQEDHDERDTAFKVEVSNKPVGAILEGMDEPDSFQSQDLRGARQSEDAVDKVHDQEVHPTHEADASSENVTHDSTEKSEIFSGNLMDQAEISDTQQSELVVKSADNSGAEQDDSNPDDKQDEHPTEESSLEALKESTEDHHGYDTETPQISDTERVDTAEGHVFEIEDGLEDDIKHCADQVVHLEREGFISGMKEIDSPSQALQSEIHFPLDFQPQQTDTDFNPIGNRRKLGSSRRKKGQQHVEESAAESHHEHKQEDGESLKAEKDLETTHMLVSIEKASHEELSPISEHDVVTPETTDTSLYSDIMSGYSSEIQNPTTTNYPEADLESSLPKNEEVQEDHDERDTAFKMEVSNTPVGAILEGMDESDSFQSQDLRSARQSEDAVDKVHDQEVHPTHEADASSENVTHDSTEKSEIFSGNLMDQAEISDTQQSELVVKSADNSGAEQEDSNPDDKQDEHPTEESSVEALKESTEDHHGYDTETPQISDIERVDTAEGQVFEVEGGLEDDIKHCADQVVHLEREGFISEMKEIDSPSQALQSEIHFPLDFQPQQTDTDFNPIGNRRKLGSSRRKKGQQHVEESAAESHHEHKREDVESLKAEKDLETTHMLVSIEKASHEELNPISEHDVVTPETTDTSLYSDIMSSYSSEIQNPTTTNYPEADLESSLPKNEEIQEDHDERDTAFKVEVSNKPVGAILEGMDEPDSFQSQDLRGACQSEDAVDKVHDQEVHPTHEADASSENVTHDSTEKSEIFSGNLMDQAEISDTQQSELVVKSADNSGAEQEDSNPDDKQDEHPTEQSSVEALKESTEDHHGYDTETPQISDIERVDTAEGQVFEIEGGLEDDIKHCADRVVHLEREGFISGIKEINSPPQTLPDFQPQQTDTDFNPIGNRRKLGSSRRKRGTQHDEDSVYESYHKPMEKIVGNNRSTEATMSLSQQSKEQGNSLETTRAKMDIFDTAQTEGVCDQVKENTHDGSLHSKLTVDQQLSHRSDATNVPFVYSVTEKEARQDENAGTTLSRQYVNLQDNNLLSDVELKLEDIETSVTMEESIETHKPREQPEPESSTEQELDFSPKFLKNGEQEENVMHNNTIVTTDITFNTGRDNSVKSPKGVNEEEKNLTKELDSLSQFTGHDVVKRDSLEDHSTIRNISHNDYNTEVKSSLNIIGQNKVGVNIEDPIKKDHQAQAVSASQEITYAKQFSATHNETDTSAPFGLEEACRAESAVDVESGITTAMGACNRQQGIHETTDLDKSENLQGKSKQKRRKMGSTRRSQFNKKPEEGRDSKDEAEESDLSIEANMEKSDKTKATEELLMTVTKEASQNENAKLSLGHMNTEQLETSASHHKGHCVSHIEEVPNPAMSVCVADIRDGERHVDVNVEPSQPNDFTCAEMHITSRLIEENATISVITGRNSVSLGETTQTEQNDEGRPENENIIQDQASAEGPIVAVANLETETSVVRGGAGEQHKDVQTGTEETNYTSEGGHIKNLEMKNASPNLNSPNRRRKMGSTCKNLRSQNKGEDLHQKQKVDDDTIETTANVGGGKTEGFPAIKEKQELELLTEDKNRDSEQKKVFETVEYGHSGESHFKPPSHSSTEESPVSHDQQVETEYPITPAIPSTSPKHDVMSETAGGRRRKLGSHRKSHGPQSNDNQTAKGDRVTDTQNKTNVKSIVDESAVKTDEKEYAGLRKISELDESVKNPSSGISTWKAGEHSRPVSEKTPVPPVQHPYADISLGRQSQTAFSLAGSPREAALRSKSYNVMMVGDSSVGKTSFMKRAQSGKFSLDIPSSIGIDSCLWPVVVDGKPVTLRLWDTAGQERFRSITRQIFHKAQAFLLMYDVTSSKSFSAVSYWASCIQEGAAENVVILLLGNKSDHAERQVKTHEGEILAKEYNFEFMECSAATGENVIQSLETVARILSQKVDTQEETTVLHKEPTPKKSSGCC